MIRRKNKRSQMEIMGLMIVVILLIVGVLFAIKFVVLKKPPETRQTYSRTQMASNMGIALMSSTTENCRDTAIKNLLIDCAEWPENGGTITCGDGMKSCDYASEAISTILNNTLDTWNVRYYMIADTKKNDIFEDNIFHFSNRDCKTGMPGESESFFLPTNRGLLTLKIFMCE